MTFCRFFLSRTDEEVVSPANHLFDYHDLIVKVHRIGNSILLVTDMGHDDVISYDIYYPLGIGLLHSFYLYNTLFPPICVN
jgi:hypothetical protein